MSLLMTGSIYANAKIQNAYYNLAKNKANNFRRDKSDALDGEPNALGETFSNSDLDKYKKMQEELEKNQRKLEKKLEEAKELEKKMEDALVKEKLARIDAKLKSGIIPSAEEMAFLKKHAPQLYKEVLELIKEREEYKAELRRCQSKEEAENVHNNKLSGALKKVKPDGSNISSIMNTIAAYNDEFIEFKHSKRYKSLPDKAEDSNTKPLEDDAKVNDRNKDFYENIDLNLFLLREYEEIRYDEEA